jgi:hypothetical protein
MCRLIAAETLDEGYFQTSEESEAFRREYEMRRIKQAGFFLFMSLVVIKCIYEFVGKCHHKVS